MPTRTNNTTTGIAANEDELVVGTPLTFRTFDEVEEIAEEDMPDMPTAPDLTAIDEMEEDINVFEPARHDVLMEMLTRQARREEQKKEMGTPGHCKMCGVQSEDNVCKKCKPSVRNCHQCGHERHKDNGYENEDKFYCNSCFQYRFASCQRCGTATKISDLSFAEGKDSGCCAKCVLKDKSSSTPHQSPRSTITAGKRTFGIELEVLLPSNQYESALRYMPNDTYATHDGSIHIASDEERGIEFVSPILKGAKGLQYVSDLVDSINKGKGFTNESCGYHVHIGMSDVYKKMPSPLKRVLHATSITELIEDSSKILKSLSPLGQNMSVVAFPDYKIKEMNSNNLYPQDDYSFYSDVETKAVDKKTHQKLLQRSTAHSYGVSGQGNLYVYRLKGDIVKREEKYYYAIVPPRKVAKNTLLWMNNVYATFDPVFRGFFNELRRDNNFSVANKYILESSIFKKDGRDTGFGSTHKTVLGVPATESKYSGLNLRAIERHGTLEVRYHPGSVDKTEIIHWITLHQHIFDYVITNIKSGRQDTIKDMCHEADFFVTPSVKFELLASKLTDLPESVKTFYLQKLASAEEEDKKCMERLNNRVSDDRLPWSHKKSNRRQTRI